MAYRNKTYVAFDGDTDIHYYYLMCAWHENSKIDFDFYDAHDLSQARDSSHEESIKASLAERLRNASEFVVLIGQNTRYLTKFVLWEMEQALKRDLPIIACNLNNMRQMDLDLCPPVIRDELAIHVPFKPAIMKYAIDNWPRQHGDLRAKNKTGPFYYGPDIYARLGL